MTDTLKVLLLLILSLSRSTTSQAEDFSLESLRLFFTPEERNSAQVVATVEAKTPVKQRRKLMMAPVKPPVRYVGEIRSQTKRRLFWKRREGEFVTTIPITEQGHGKAKNKAAPIFTKTKPSE